MWVASRPAQRNAEQLATIAICFRTWKYNTSNPFRFGLPRGEQASMIFILYVPICAAFIIVAFAAGVEAKNSFRVERIFRYETDGAETCDDAWARMERRFLEQDPVPESAEFPPLIMSIPHGDGVSCTATFYSRHFGASCVAGSFCDNRACVPVEQWPSDVANSAQAARGDRLSCARRGTRG